MDLSTYKFPKVTNDAEIVFSNLSAYSDLVEEARNRNLIKGRDKFNELFFKGGEIKLQDDVKGTWKENAHLYALALMHSFAPKHENKEAVCAMIFEQTLKLES